MSELKACPFCGTSVVGIEHDGLYRWVECGNMDCNAAGKVFAFLTDVGNADHIVANNWNTRPIEDGLRAELARLTAELAELREKTRWIPVSERLPEDSGQYICAIRYNEEPKKTWVEQRFWNIFWWDMYTSIVTHWMPLPEPPEATDADN